MTARGEVVAVSVSEAKGEKKHNVPEVFLEVEHGIRGDAHAGPWHRQVSLLALESIQRMRDKGIDVGPGDFAENLTTRGLALSELPVGTRIKIGAEVLAELTQIGKECHDRCAIFAQVGDCVMPREGVFVRVLTGGRVVPGDPIEVLK